MDNVGLQNEVCSKASGQTRIFSPLLTSVRPQSAEGARVSRYNDTVMLKLLLVIAGAYLLLVAFVYLTQASMLYLPNMPGRELLAAPDTVGLDYEDITLEASDGIQNFLASLNSVPL